MPLHRRYGLLDPTTSYAFVCNCFNARRCSARVVGLSSSSSACNQFAGTRTAVGKKPRCCRLPGRAGSVHGRPAHVVDRRFLQTIRRMPENLAGSSLTCDAGDYGPMYTVNILSNNAAERKLILGSMVTVQRNGRFAQFKIKTKHVDGGNQ